ncbi:hypothetical protein RRG08_032086 [Elysia crispata]|uniref:Uncharacterized protein n=1 Tax=Elysia crispata TaxID=231223 RepID=A0AAE0ZDF7_9GAST|nr:hypothetical protein RRG08_032086 [Elysia crispata]
MHAIGSDSESGLDQSQALILYDSQNWSTVITEQHRVVAAIRTKDPTGYVPSVEHAGALQTWQLFISSPHVSVESMFNFLLRMLSTSDVFSNQKAFVSSIPAYSIPTDTAKCSLDLGSGLFAPSSEDEPDESLPELPVPESESLLATERWRFLEER